MLGGFYFWLGAFLFTNTVLLTIVRRRGLDVDACLTVARWRGRDVDVGGDDVVDVGHDGRLLVLARVVVGGVS